MAARDTTDAINEVIGEQDVAHIIWVYGIDYGIGEDVTVIYRDVHTYREFDEFERAIFNKAWTRTQKFYQNDELHQHPIVSMARWNGVVRDTFSKRVRHLVNREFDHALFTQMRVAYQFEGDYTKCVITLAKGNEILIFSGVTKRNPKEEFVDEIGWNLSFLSALCSEPMARIPVPPTQVWMPTP